MSKITGKIFDLASRSFFNGSIVFEEGKIISIQRLDFECDNYILPGLVDAHVHIESSMLIPSRFAQMVIPHGTVAVVSDPHEIANVTGLAGIDFMIKDGESVPLKCFFGAPSCVPATGFDRSGGVIDSDDIARLMNRDDIWFLSEMMNFPGVIHNDSEVHHKIQHAHLANKKVDGHAPGLTGADLKKYAQAGITTDHECFSLAEALEKIALGMNIQIREGSAASNFEELHSLLVSHVDRVMLCTDDSHPDEIIRHGHMNRLIKLGLAKGISIFNLIEACVYNPVKHYNLPVGLLRVNDSADFIVVDTIEELNVLETYIDGVKVFSDNKIGFELPIVSPINFFNASAISVDDLVVSIPSESSFVKVIEVIENQLLTKQFNWPVKNHHHHTLDSSVGEDVLKIVVYNRYHRCRPFVGFVKGFGLTRGAFASSIAHDCHHIISVGTSDDEIVKAINNVIAMQGGITAVDGSVELSLALPFGGIMTAEPGEIIALRYERLVEQVKMFGSKLKSPFMTLSFMSLLVIPSLKIGDRGLFDVNQFKYVDLIE